MNKDGLVCKFEPKTFKGIFLGYAPSNTYSIYFPEKDKMRNEYNMKQNETMNRTQLLKNKDKRKYKKNDELETRRIVLEQISQSKKNPYLVCIMENHRFLYYGIHLYTLISHLLDKEINADCVIKPPSGPNLLKNISNFIGVLNELKERSRMCNKYLSFYCFISPALQVTWI